MKTTYSRLTGVLPVLCVLSLTYFTMPSALKFHPDGLNSLPAIFGYLVFISMFVERAIEVFLSAWRSAGADELDNEITLLKLKLEGHLKGAQDDGCVQTSDELIENLSSLQIERAQYRANSRFISQWMGLTFGVLLSLVGIRILDNLVVVDAVESGLQMQLFVVIDVVITGMAIAGGSGSINKIMKVYNKFMESTAIRVRTEDAVIK